MIIKSLLISCANDSQVCVPFPNTQTFILANPLRNGQEKRDVLSALPKRHRQVPHFSSPNQKTTSTKKPQTKQKKPPNSQEILVEQDLVQAEAEGRGRLVKRYRGNPKMEGAGRASLL